MILPIGIPAKVGIHFSGAGCLPFGIGNEHEAAGSSLAGQWVPAFAGTR
jgi:hypothetical protein